MGKWMCGSTNSHHLNQMVVSGQRNTLAALRPVHPKLEDGCATVRSERFGKKTNLLPLPGIEPRLFG